MKNVSWHAEQRQDVAIARVIDLLSVGSRPLGEDTEPPAVRRLLREWNRLHLDRGVLYRNATQDGQPVKQLVVPESHRASAFNGIHKDVGHPGKDKTRWLARHFIGQEWRRILKSGSQAVLVAFVVKPQRNLWLNFCQLLHLDQCS